MHCLPVIALLYILDPGVTHTRSDLLDSAAVLAECVYGCAVRPGPIYAALLPAVMLAIYCTNRW